MERRLRFMRVGQYTVKTVSSRQMLRGTFRVVPGLSQSLPRFLRNRSSLDAPAILASQMVYTERDFLEKAGFCSAEGDLHVLYGVSE